MRMYRPRRGSAANAHRGQHARAHQEGAQQRQRKRQDRQQDGPRAQAAAFFGDRLGVDQRGADQPWHETGVFHRVPEPPAAPAQFRIGPPAAGDDAGGEAGPGHIGPRPSPAYPGLFEVAADQCRHCECECHRKPDIAGVQHWRVEGHARVLQHRIEFVAIQRNRRQPPERIGRQQYEGQKAQRDQPQDRQHAGGEALRQVPAEGGQQHRPGGQDGDPQQQRAFVGAPHRRNAVVPGQGDVGVGGDVGHRKSSDNNDQASRPNAIHTNTAWPTAAGRAIPINAVLPRHAPIKGSTPWASDNSSARISAIWPSSGVMGGSQGETERGRHRRAWQ